MDRNRHNERGGHRTERIRHAVLEALEFTLLPSLSDPELQGLWVVDVEVARGLSSIRVLLGTRSPSDGQADALKKAEPHLRSELAGILLLKKMPTLTLKVLS